MKRSGWITALALGAVSAVLCGQGIKVTSPNSPDEWCIGGSYIIKWKSLGVTGDVDIILRLAGNPTAPPVLGIAAATANDGTENWTIPATVAPGNYLVRIRSKNDASIYDDSRDFDIKDCATITVTSPNGGEKWGVGSIRAITWDTAGLSGNAQITLFKNNGARFDRIAKVPVLNGSYSWTVGETEVLKRTNSGYVPLGDYRIEIQAGGLKDRSDAAFAIQESKLPDLVTGDLLFSTVGKIGIIVKEPRFGDEIKAIAYVRNVGQAPTGRSIPCEISVEGADGFAAKKAEVSVPPLAVNETHPISIEYKCTHIGTMNVKTRLDIMDHVIEADENNNTSLYKHRVMPLPDLVLVDVVWNASRHLGDTHEVWGKVKNVGKGPSPQAQLDAICSGDKKRTTTIRPLKPGETEPFKFRFEYWTAGSKRGQLMLDKENRVRESNEENNRVQFSLEVKKHF